MSTEVRGRLVGAWRDGEYTLIQLRPGTRAGLARGQSGWLVDEHGAYVRGSGFVLMRVSETSAVARVALEVTRVDGTEPVIGDPGAR